MGQDLAAGLAEAAFEAEAAGLRLDLPGSAEAPGREAFSGLAGAGAGAVRCRDAAGSVAASEGRPS